MMHSDVMHSMNIKLGGLMVVLTDASWETSSPDCHNGQSRETRV
jgi:hypothetical protein